MFIQIILSYFIYINTLGSEQHPGYKAGLVAKRGKLQGYAAYCAGINIYHGGLRRPACFFGGNDILAVGQVFKLAGSLRRGPLPARLQTLKRSIPIISDCIQPVQRFLATYWLHPRAQLQYLQNSNLTFQNSNFAF